MHTLGMVCTLMLHQSKAPECPGSTCSPPPFFPPGLLVWHTYTHTYLLLILHRHLLLSLPLHSNGDDLLLHLLLHGHFLPAARMDAKCAVQSIPRTVYVQCTLWDTARQKRRPWCWSFTGELKVEAWWLRQFSVHDLQLSKSADPWGVCDVHQSYQCIRHTCGVAQCV